MSCASIRVSIRWGAEEPFENTRTLVLTSPEGRFVDLRVFKDKNELEWVLTGKEQVLQEDPLILEFQHDINTHVEGLTGFDGHTTKYDTGEFHSIEGSKDRLEVGNMYNGEKGKDEDYEEVWRTIDPESIQNGYIHKEHSNECKEYSVYEVKDSNWLGILIQLGDLYQGALLNKKTREIIAIRQKRDLDSNWETVYSQGDLDLLQVNNPTINWIQKEVSPPN